MKKNTASASKIFLNKEVLAKLKTKTPVKIEGGNLNTKCSGNDILVGGSSDECLRSV